MCTAYEMDIINLLNLPLEEREREPVGSANERKQRQIAQKWR